jgi:hypothetical protein
MSNPIKYSTGTESLALKKGNFYIGTGDVGKGPTSSTGYYNGITPPSGGYTIYLNKATGGPSIYTTSNDTQLISLTNSIADTSYTTVNECLNYFAGQTDKLCVNRDYEGIVTEGLTHLYDFGYIPSYPKNGTSVNNLLSSNSGSLINGPSFITDNGGAITCDGANDYVTTDITVEAATNSNLQSICVWLKGGFITGVDVYDNNSFTGSDADSNGKFHLIITYDQSNRIFFAQSWYGGHPTEPNYYATVSPQSWNYMVMVKKSIKTYDVYYNGVLVMSNCTREANLSSKFNLGRWWSNQYVRSLGTSMVYNYNRSLTSSEITQNYNAQKGRFGL